MSILIFFFPYAFAIIIFIAAARLFLISEQFNLPIFNYLEFADLPINVIQPIYGFSQFLLATIVLVFLKGIMIMVHANIIINPEIQLKFRAIGIAAFIPFVILILKARSLYYLEDSDFGQHKKICWMMYAGLCMMAVSLKSLSDSYVDGKLLIFTMIFIFSWVFCKSLAKYEVSQLKKAKISKGTVIKLKDISPKKIISTDTVYYIGNTTKYAFVYDELNKTCTAYSMSNIISISNVK